MAYLLYNWKKSTLLTLERLEGENKKGIRPKSSFFRSGACAAWLALLKKGGFVGNEGGYFLTQSGFDLLKQLQLGGNSNLITSTPRGKFKKESSQQANLKASQPADDIYHLEIKGPNFYVGFQFNCSNPSNIHRAAALFHDQLKNKGSKNTSSEIGRLR